MRFAEMNWVIITAVMTIVALAIALLLFSEIIFSIPLRLVSKVSGWCRLGELFPQNFGEEGTRFRFCTVCIDAMCYRSCVTATIDSNYLTLSPMFPFRPYHPAISIPRDRLRLVSEKVRTFRLTKFEIVGADKTIRLPSRIALKL